MIECEDIKSMAMSIQREIDVRFKDIICGLDNFNLLSTFLDPRFFICLSKDKVTGARTELMKILDEPTLSLPMSTVD